jgi:hypothetical protein
MKIFHLLSKSAKGAARFKVLIRRMNRYKHMPSQHMYWGSIWDLTQVYLEQKLAIEFLLYNFS